MNQGVIRPFCDILSCQDSRIIQVALDGLEYILRVGEEEKARTKSGENEYALYVEEAGGMDKIHQLQNDANLDVYNKAFLIIDKYFGDEEEDSGMAPELDASTGQYTFGTNMQVPDGGFAFQQ